MNNSNATIRLDAATLAHRINLVIVYAEKKIIPARSAEYAIIEELQDQYAKLKGYADYVDATAMIYPHSFIWSPLKNHAWKSTREMQCIVDMCNASTMIEINQHMFDKIESFTHEAWDNELKFFTDWTPHLKRIIENEKRKQAEAVKHVEEPEITHVPVAPSDDNNSGRALVFGVIAFALIVAGALLLT